METITAVIPAKNEEKNIARCLESVRWCDRMLVMWMGDDKTGEIAEKLGTEVVAMNKSAKDDFIAVQKNINWAIDHCKTDWVLRIDADEVCTEELRDEIKQVLTFKSLKSSNVQTLKSSNVETFQTFVAYGIPRKQYFLGDFLRGGDWAYDRLVRLFRPQCARYEPLVAVHEQFKVDGKTGYLQNALLHYSHPTLNDVFRKFNSYTDVQINDIHDSLAAAVFKMLTQPPYVFLRWMIWHRGYRDGVRGIVAGTLRGWYEFILYKKYLGRKTI